MIVNGASDTVLCHCFPNYLDGPALDWLCALPAGSIPRFQQLEKLFEEHFAGSAIYLHDSDYLNTVKQGPNESLKDYMTRFTKVAISIPDLHPEVHLHAIKSGLRPGKFQETIAVAKPKTLAEFREKFNTKREDIIKEILNSKLIKPPRKAGTYQDTKNVDKSKYCAFHQKHGHNTDDCVVAKDLLERLARQGHLDKYIGGHIQNRGSSSATIDIPEQNRGKEKASSSQYEKPRAITNQQPEVTFTHADFNSSIQNLDDPVVVTLQLGDLLVKKVLLDPGSSADVLFYSTFQKMKLSNNMLQSTGGDLVGFSGERVPILGSVWLQTTLGEHPLSKTYDIQYLVVDCFSPYNLILGRPFLNKFGTIVSTVHLCVKFPLQDDQVVTIHGDHKEARQCYNISMKFQNRSTKQVNNVDLKQSGHSLADLDPRADFLERPKPSDDLQKVYFNNDPNKFTYVGTSISKFELQAITTFLQEQADLFAWTPSDMPGIDPQIISHKLAINPAVRPVQQKKRKLGEEKKKASLEETQKLINAEFIKEIRFTTWLANVVMGIIKYSCTPPIKIKRLLSLISIGRNIEVYVDDMVAKTQIGHSHISDLTEIFGQIRQYNMRLNPEKCAFAVQGGAIPEGVENNKKFRRQASSFTIFNGTLYRRGYTRPLLKCLNNSEAEIVLAEAHEGICGTHTSARSLASKVLRAGFFWPTLKHDSQQKIRSCNNCQRHAPLIHIPAEQLHHSDINWPFNQWGLDILGPFPTAPGQNLKIKQHFASVEHPQTNGLAEAANKVILHALKKKLDDAKGLWAELIPEVLWRYNTTPQTSTKETPFRLVYGSEAMIPLEISQSSFRTQLGNQEEARRAELDTIEEVRDIATLRQRAAQQAIARQYNKAVKSRSFMQGDLVLRKTETAQKPPHMKSSQQTGTAHTEYQKYSAMEHTYSNQ
ncbi:uncharacterized protein [Arachis hypogaea]|uniref:uncharacterized protein n=1 Tax=Arachis hypogaea TaxID=3818 RepID=UPI003B213D9D